MLGLQLDQRRDGGGGGDYRARPAAAERREALETELETPPVDLVEERSDLVREHVVDVADEAQREMIVLRIDPARARQASAQHRQRERDIPGNFEGGEQAGRFFRREPRRI